ncbi:hypothetical protein lerEdw1_020834 [Lerista edwardsae]|nr:hypothetical protein lerEdw1_020834 [Lerista edwardsae]
MTPHSLLFQLPPQEETLQVTSTPSKRVTISGVTGPSGNDFLQEETGNLSPTGTPGKTEGSGAAAPLGAEASEAPSAKAAGASEANTAAVDAEASTGGHISRPAERTRPGSRGSPRKSSVARTLQKPSRRRAGQSSTRDRERQTKAKKDLVAPRETLPSSKPSEKIPSTRDASKKGTVSSNPARSQKFISAGPSVDIISVLVDSPSIGDGSRAWEQEESRVKSQKRSRRDENRRPNSQPSAEPSKPASSVSRKANKRSKATGRKTAGATKSQKQSQAGPREKTSSGPAGHVSEESASELKPSKKSISFLKSHSPLDGGHHRRKTESAVTENSQMDKDTPAAGQSKLSSKRGPRLQDSRLFRPGGWVEYVETGNKKSNNKEPSGSKMADSSRPSNRAAREVTRASSELAIHAGGDTTARSGL